MKNLIYYRLLGLFLVVVCNIKGLAQISIPNGAFSYSQDFNSLALTGTSSTVPSGWAFFETGSNQNSLYSAGTGSSNAGDTYSYGLASDTERSFGGLQSGSLIQTVGVCYTNNTGFAINSFTISYVGETWRVGTANRTDGIQFQYNQNTTAISGAGTWVSFPALDYFNPGQATTGNATLQHSTNISATLTGLNIAPGSTFCFRWNDFSATGADDGIAIDDFVLNNIVIAPQGITVTESAGSTNITEGGATDSYSIVLESMPTADVIITIIPDLQSTVSPLTLTFTPSNWNIPQSVTVTAVDDLTIEGPHNSTISQSASSTDGGYNGLSVSSVTCNITDNDLPPVICSITDISVSNMSACFDNATPLNAADDYFTADITVVFSGKPGIGTLNLSGDLLAGAVSAGVGLIGETTYTFTGLNFASDGTPVLLNAVFSDNMTCSLTESEATTAPEPCSVITDCSFPYFSEYIEGSGNNKCLEIYNPSSSSIDLAAGGYKIEMYFNGNQNSTLFLNLAGIILPGNVFVVCNSSATPDFIGQADQIGSGGWYNGDDAVVLRNAGGILDVIGQIGVDPGTNWSDFDVETSEQTLRRYSFIQKGDNNGSDAFNPGDEWETYPQNTLWGLGYHATECQPSLPYGWNPVSIGCNTGTSAYNDNTNTWTQTSNCFNPNSGADDLTFVFEELCGDGEIVAQYMGVTPFGFAGLMMRENATASSKYVWLFNRANSNTSWGVRSVTGAAPLIQAKPHLNRTWMKLNRTGNVFRGYLSPNGITWQLLFQSAATFNECLLVGIATHSNVDGNTVTSMFKNVNIPNDDLRPAGSNYDQYTFNTETRSCESIGVEVYPNPVTGILNVRFNNRVDLSENTLAQIVDLNGRLVMQQTFERENDELMSFDVSSLNSGIYLLKLSTGSKTEIIKVVKH